MPLDVQPLSTRRQILRILVMLALLAGSLGLAHVLIMRHEPAAKWHVEFPSPPGVSQMPVNESVESVLDGVMVEAAATWPQGERHFIAFSWNDPQDIDANQYIRFILSQVLTDTPSSVLHLQPKLLGGYAAMEAETHERQGENAAFAIIRLATVEGHVAAFCFSGNSAMTDADRKFFGDYCSRQIRVRLDRAPRG
jgi:hypothetical protein